MVPFEAALSEEPVYLASDDRDQWQRARRWEESDRKLTSCRAIKSLDRCVGDRRRQAHGKANEPLPRSAAKPIRTRRHPELPTNEGRELATRPPQAL